MASVVVRNESSVNIFFSRTPGLILTKFWYEASLGKENEKLNFMTPTQGGGGGNFWVKSVKYVFLKKNPLCYGALYDDNGRVY